MLSLTDASWYQYQYQFIVSVRSFLHNYATTTLLLLLLLHKKKGTLRHRYRRLQLASEGCNFLQLALALLRSCCDNTLLVEVSRPHSPPILGQEVGGRWGVWGGSLPLLLC